MQDEPKIARTATTAPRELTAAEMQRAGGGYNVKLETVLVSSYQSGGGSAGSSDPEWRYVPVRR